MHIERQRDLALNEFTYIADRASSGVFEFMDERFIETVQEDLVASKTLEGLIVYGPNGGEYPFEKNQGRAINMVNNSPRFKNRFDFSRQPLYRPLHIQNLQYANIEAKALAVDYGKISDILKQTLIIVSAALVLAFFTLLMESLLDKSGGKRRQNISYEEHNYSYPMQEKIPKRNDRMQESEAREFRQEPRQIQIPLESKPKAQKTQTRELPKGLYSPRSNIGWEEYTSTRLDSELRRCSANEQDLVYLAMEFKELNISDENFYLNFANDAVAFFTMRDMIFEKGKSGIAVILPNADLETAFAKANEFHTRCLSKYRGVFKSKTDLCTGLSSRSGRLIDAQRLIFEANEALEKALLDPVSHIIAFKSDPEKYRAFIASKNEHLV